MPDGEPSVEEGVRAFVAATFGRRAGEVKPLGAGAWSRAYALTLDGKDVVLRFGDHVEDFLKDQAMGRLRRPGLPVPAVIAVGEADEGCFAISERLFGRALDDLDGSRMRRALPSLFALLDVICTVELPGTGYGPWSADDGCAACATWEEALVDSVAAGPRLSGWREQLDLHCREAAIFDDGVAAMREAARGLVVPRRLVHADLLARNVLVEDGRISGVIDWGNAMYGDPLYDIAWLLYWWEWYPAWTGIRIGDEVRHHFEGAPERLWGEARRLRACLLHIGLAHIAYTAWRGRLQDMRRNADQVATYL